MITILAITITATFLLGLFLGHVIGFGVRTRNTVIHSDPAARPLRDTRDRKGVLWEKSPRAGTGGREEDLQERDPRPSPEA